MRLALAVAALGALSLPVLPAAAQSVAASSNGVGTPFELAFWQSVTGSDDPAVYEAYLQQYPQGTFSALARAKISSLRKAMTPAAPPVPAKALPIEAPTIPPSPVAAAPVLVAERAIAPPATKPRAEPQMAADTALLAELAKSQEPGGSDAAVVAVKGFALPPRPALAEVPDLPLPSAFCTAEQRNAFYEARYKPVLEQARLNNLAAVAHMQKLQQVYDSYQLGRDATPMNALALEARDYQQQVATVTYSRQAALVRQFDTLMAVPVGACPVVATK